MKISTDNWFLLVAFIFTLTMGLSLKAEAGEKEYKAVAIGLGTAETARHLSGGKLDILGSLFGTKKRQQGQRVSTRSSTVRSFPSTSTSNYQSWNSNNYNNRNQQSDQPQFETTTEEKVVSTKKQVDKDGNFIIIEEVVRITVIREVK